jgi:type I restriction enzyme M protein
MARVANERLASKDSTANIRFEAKLWLAADKLRNNMDAAKYKRVVSCDGRNRPRSRY